jgi:hypothetical protein
MFGAAAVLACIVIAGKQATAGKGEIEEAGDRNISDEADDQGIGEGTPLGSQSSFDQFFDHLCLFFK